MFARATTIQGRPENVEEGIARYREALSQFREMSGNQGAFLLVDRSSGKAVGITLWDSEQSVTESRERANELRERAAEEAQGDIQSVEEYEVAVWEPGV